MGQNTIYLAKSGSGTLVLTGSLCFTANGGDVVNINAGTLQIGNGGNTGDVWKATSDGSHQVNDYGTLAFDRSDNYTFMAGSGTNGSNTMGTSGSGNILMIGTGVTTLPYTLNYTGAAIVDSGTLQIGNGTSGEGLASTSVSISSGAILAFSHSDNITISPSGGIAGNGGIAKNGTGILLLSGTNNTYAGGTIINAGAVTATNSGALGAFTSPGGGVYVAPAATLGVYVGGSGWSSSSLSALTNASTFSTGSFLGMDTSAAGGSYTLSGSLTGGFGLNKLGSGVLVLSSTANNYSGGTKITAGTLNFASGALPLSAIAFAGGELQWASGNTQDISAGLAPIAFGQTAVIDTNTNNVSLYTAISGTGGLTKVGAGALTLAASNTYQGTTTVSTGTLQLGDGLSSNGSVAGNIVNNATLVFANPNAQSYSGTISGGNGNYVYMSGAGTLTLNGNNTYTGFTMVNSGALILAGTSSTNGNARIQIFGGMVNFQSAAALPGGEIDFMGSSGTLQVGGNGITVNNLIYAAPAVANQSVLIDAQGYNTTFAGNMGPGYLANCIETLNNNGTALVSGNINFSNANGTFVKTGTGTMVFTGTVNYAAGVQSVTVNAGTLQIGNGGTSGDINQIANNNNTSITDNATLVLDRSGNYTFGGAGTHPEWLWVNGNGSMFVEGGGVTTVLGRINISGATTVSSGTLVVGGQIDGTVITNSGNVGPVVINGGAMLSGSTAYALTGSGNGQLNAVTINESGVLNAFPGVQMYMYRSLNVAGGTLSGGGYYLGTGNSGGTDTGPQTYAFTSAPDGTPAVISAGSINLPGNITFSVTAGGSPGAVDLNVSGNLINTPGKNGGLTKTGNGLMVVSGVGNTYTGDTDVNGGVLAVNGSLPAASGVYVNPTGVLAGSGSVGSVQVLSGGALSPGFTAGVGTLAAANVTLFSGSALNYTIGSAANGLLNVINSGNFTIGSSVTLNITPAAGWGNGTYELATFNAGSLTDNSSSFSGWTVAGSGLGSHTYSFTDTGGSLDVVVSAPIVTTVSGTWGNNGGGSWSTAGNWSGSLIPTATNDTALFASTTASGTATVTLDGSHTLSGLTFNNTGASYAITTGTGGNLTLVATSGAVTLANSGGSHSIGASVALGSNLEVTTAGGSMLTISGPVTQINTGTSLNLSGSGALLLSGSDSYSGGTTVNSGTLNVNGAQALPTSGVLVVGRSGRVVLGNITGAAEMVAASPLTSESTSLASVPAASSIDSSAAEQASSAAVQVSVPIGAPVSGGPAAVPEPSTVLLLLVGAAALAVWRRKNGLGIRK